MRAKCDPGLPGPSSSPRFHPFQDRKAPTSIETWKSSRSRTSRTPPPATMTIGRVSACLLRSLQTQQKPIGRALPKWPQHSTRTTPPLPPRRPFSTTPRRPRQAADDPNFTSIVDNPPELVRTGRRHGPGLIILGKLDHHDHQIHTHTLPGHTPKKKPSLTPLSQQP